MRTFLKWAVATLCLAACGGNVVVDEPTSTGGTQTTTSSSVGVGASTPGNTSSGVMTGTGTFTTGTTTFTSSTSTSTSSGTPTCETCGEWMTGGSLGLCSGNASAFAKDLLNCACGASSCSTACGYNFCQHQPISAPCTQCLENTCGAAYMNCVAN